MKQSAFFFCKNGLWRPTCGGLYKFLRLQPLFLNAASLTDQTDCDQLRFTVAGCGPLKYLQKKTHRILKEFWDVE